MNGRNFSCIAIFFMYFYLFYSFVISNDFNGTMLRNDSFELGNDNESTSNYSQPDSTNRSFPKGVPKLDKKITNVSQTLDRMLSANYDPRIRPRPSSQADSRTMIRVSTIIHSMALTSESDRTFQIELTLMQTWWDERIRGSSNDSSMSISLDTKFHSRIWRPNTHFYNSMESNIHQVTTPNEDMIIRYVGVVHYTMRLNVKLRCPMTLRNFPIDEHICPLIIGSYSYDESKLIYRSWRRDKLNSDELQLLMAHSQFMLIRYRYRPSVMHYKAGNYSVLRLEMYIKRKAGYYFIRVYLPCSLMVILSWVSFWINREATGDRISLGITTVLTLSTFVMETRKDLPEVNYATALDVFIFICFTFVIAAIFEFVGVHYFTKIGSGDHPEDYDDSDQSDNDSDWKTVEVTHCIGDESTPSKVTAGSDLQQSEIFRDECKFQSPDEIIQQSVQPSDEMVVKVRHQALSLTPSNPTESDSNREWKLKLTSKDYRLRRIATCCIKCLCCLLGSQKFRTEMRRESRGPNSISKIDRVSRFLFPVAFVVINIFYWYICVGDDDNADEANEESWVMVV